ncbi:uncharacterized protein [Diadema setosum]|uniref:uncharacterized protein n=1 Tax=Diadema setosum TaxID=31175 RepID=UPI003B3A61DE
MNPEKHPASGDTRRMPERPGGDLLGKQGAGNEKLAKPMQTESMGNANSGHNTRQGHGHGNGNGARGGGDSGGMAKQTDSVGHAVVDKPMIQLHKEKLEGGGGGGGGEGEWSETSRLLQEETGRGRTGSGGRASRGGGAGGGVRGGGTGGRGGGRNHGQSDIKVLVPADCGNFLADHISTSDISPLLMDLGLSYVQVEDLRSKHQLNLREMRVEGIIAALLKLPHNEQLPGLIGALINRGLRRQAELFCEHFGLDLVLISDQCRGPSSNSQRVAGKAAALPVRTPQNHLEKALQPFLQDAHNLPALTCQVRKGPAISLDKLSQFKEVFQLWRERDIDMFNREVTDCVAPHFKEELGGSNLRLFRVLDAWAAVELERSSLRGGITERDVEYLAKACRKIKVYHILRKHLKDGVAGPAIARQTYLRAIPFTLKNQLVQELDVKRGDGKDWRALAQFVGYNDKIRLWQQKDSPAELVWETWKTRNVATVGALYDWAVNNERTDLAAVLEAE